MVVHVGRLTLLADFHVLDMNKDPTCPLLVGRGFLATASAIIDCKMSKIVVGEGSARSIYHVKKHSYYNEGEKIPYEIMLDRKPSRYGPWTNRDFVGPRRPFYLEETFVSNSTLNQQQLARDIEVNPFEDTLVFRKMTEFLGTLPINLSMNWWKGESEKAKYNQNWDRPPSDGNGEWHIRMTIYDPNGEKLENTYRTKRTKRKLKDKFDPYDILEDKLTYIGTQEHDFESSYKTHK